MNNISLLISGNLTGFGRFYTSPAAYELLGSEKISLDNHSFLSFLGKDEKAYSITFAKGFIAVSQYTSILDSFRRPGKLVVSLLIPRNYVIEPVSGSPKGAVYSLLTKISDRFFEKNFLDGMINQNLAVLGQDYYTEILEGYTLKQKDSRKINENPAPVKKVGYVRASETDIASYLDSPYRKSYGDGGYNLVFFAPSAPVGAPNSIDEEPEEVVLYKVKILNTRAILPDRVKLSSPIYKLQATSGEKQFAIEGTYNDVVNNILSPRITGRIMPGETIEIQYNFEKEEKTVEFEFVDLSTSTHIGLDMVLPSIVFPDGTRLPISSNSFTFRGSEIYSEKKIVSESSVFSISPRSERLDLTRLGNGQKQTIYVQQVFTLNVEVTPGLTYSFVNKISREKLDFTNQKTIKLSGNVSDWNVYVDTEMYFAPVQELIVQNGKWNLQGLRLKEKNIETVIKPSETNVAVQSKSFASKRINSSYEQYVKDVSDSNENRKFKWHKYIVIVPFLLVVFGCGWWVYDSFFNEQDKVHKDGEYVPDPKEEFYCYLMYVDDSDSNQDTIEVCGNVDSNKSYTHYVFKLLDENKRELKDKDYLLKEDTTYRTFNNSKEYLCHQLIINESLRNSNTKFYIRVSYKCDSIPLQIVDAEISNDSLKTHGTQCINLGIRLSQLNWYNEIKNIKRFNNIKEKDSWTQKIYKLEKSVYSDSLKALVERIAYNESSSSGKTAQYNLDRLNSVNITVQELRSFEKGLQNSSLDGNQKIGNTTVGKRIKALRVVFNSINQKDGAVRPSETDLSKEQSDAIRSAFNERNPETIKKVTDGKKFSSIPEFVGFLNSALD